MYDEDAIVLRENDADANADVYDDDDDDENERERRGGYLRARRRAAMGSDHERGRGDR